MPKFPTKEADILALANVMLAGYDAHPADFPSFERVPLLFRRSFYVNAKNAQTDALSAAQIATEQKNTKLAVLVELMKNKLKKSEVDAADNPEKLALIGWGPPKMPQSIEKPGQPNNLRSGSQGRGNLILKWDRPTCGGAARNYIVQRRCQQKTDGKFDSWKLIATAYQNHITLTNQPQKITLEYHVKAVNISGESTPSNTVAVVL